MTASGAPEPTRATPRQGPPEPPTAQTRIGSPTDPPEPPRRPSRTRALLGLVIVAALCLSYLAGWMYWAQTHVVTRYEQAPAGETVTAEGVDFRITQMVQTHVLLNEQEDADDVTAQPNAVFVVAELEVVVTDEADPDYPLCVLELVGPDGRTWEQDQLSLPPRKLPTGCFDAPRNEPYVTEMVFLVPEKYVDELAGLAVPNYTGAPEQVLTPPAGG